MKNEKEKASRPIREAPADSPVPFVFPGGETEEKRKSNAAKIITGLILITGIIAAAFYAYKHTENIPFLKSVRDKAATVSAGFATISNKTAASSEKNAVPIAVPSDIPAKNDFSSQENTDYVKPSGVQAQSSPRNKDKAREYENNGNICVTNNDKDKAIFWFDKALELDPDNYDLYFIRGLTWSNKGNHDKGIADLSRAIQLKPGDAEAYYYRAIAWAKKGDNKQSSADYDKAVKLNPDFTNDFYYRAFVMAKSGGGALPAAVYTDKFLPDKSDTKPHTDKEKIIDKGEYEKDFERVEKAIRANPDNFKAYMRRGTLWQKLKKLDKAFADFNKAIELKPDCSDAYLSRGIVFLNKGYKDKAFEDFNKAIELDSNNALAYAGRGSAMIDRDEKIACRDLRKACELNECTYIETVKEKGLCR